MSTNQALHEPGKRLGAMLLEEGVVTQGQLNEALRHQREHGGVIGRILVELGYVPEVTLISFIVKQCKIPHISLTDYEISPALIDLVPKELCLRHALVPIDHLGNILTIAMTDPLDSAALEEVRELCPDIRIKPILCSWNQYEQVIRRLFPEDIAEPEEASEMTMDSLGLAATPARPAKKPAPKSNTPAKSSPRQNGAPAPKTDPASASKFLTVIEGKVRHAVNRAVLDIGDHVRGQLAQNESLPVTTSELVTAVESALQDALHDAVGVLLYEVQSALNLNGATAGQLTPHQLSELLRASMRQALQDITTEMMAEAAMALSRRTK